ncbi:MAG: hypothetical protein KA004_00615 [Verrucomicrobiales bacterium]|nr:hypothetical protein [Verrucomicrobiales bacterium]
MFRFSKQVIALATIVAVLALQLFGVHAGYLCECQPGGSLAVGSDCESSHCHPGQGHSDDTQKGNGHHHKELRDDAKSMRSETASTAVPILLEAVGPWSGGMELHEAHLVLKPLPVLRGWLPERSPPPTGVVVARTLVLLI